MEAEGRQRRISIRRDLEGVSLRRTAAAQWPSARQAGTTVAAAPPLAHLDVLRHRLAAVQPAVRKVDDLKQQELRSGEAWLMSADLRHIPATARALGMPRTVTNHRQNCRGVGPCSIDSTICAPVNIAAALHRNRGWSSGKHTCRTPFSSRASTTEGCGSSRQKLRRGGDLLGV